MKNSTKATRNLGLPFLLLTVLLILETVSQPFPAVFYQFASLAFREQSVWTLLNAAQSLLRVLCLGFCLHFAIQLTMVSLGRWASYRVVHPGHCFAFLSLVLLVANRIQASLFDNWNEAFRIPPAAIYGSLALLGLVTARLFPAAVPSFKRREIALFSTTALMAVVLLRPSVREHSFAAPVQLSSASSPSFLLLGLDSVPSIIWESTSPVGNPLWRKNWAGQFHSIPNAFSLSNSTFTSWYSILSGRQPIESGIKSLFPSAREDGKSLLTHDLRAQGYRTVFMTDCASTSYFSTNDGFDELFQPDKGFFGCERAVVASRYAIASLFSWGSANNVFFPELDSDCSLRSRHANFFARVASKLRELAESPQPYLLAIHSCVTSVENIPRYRKQHSGDLRWSESKGWSESFVRLSKADSYLDGLLQTLPLEKKPVTMIFSDHGLASSEDGRTVTHAVGIPKGDSQYQVPFLVSRYGWKQKRTPRLPAEADLRLVSRLIREDESPLTPRAFSSSLPFETSSPRMSQFMRALRLDEEGVIAIPPEVENEMFACAPLGIRTRFGRWGTFYPESCTPPGTRGLP